MNPSTILLYGLAIVLLPFVGIALIGIHGLRYANWIDGPFPL